MVSFFENMPQPWYLSLVILIDEHNDEKNNTDSTYPEYLLYLSCMCDVCIKK